MADTASPWDDVLLGPYPGETWPVEPAPMSARREGPLAWAEYLALRGLQRALYLAPGPVAEAGIGGCARLARVLDKKHSRAADDFLHTALPHLGDEERRAWVLNAWKHLLRIVVSTEGIPRMVGRPFAEFFTADVCDDYMRIVAEKRGVMMVTCHLGNWEVSPFGLSAMGLRSSYAIGKPPSNGPLARHVVRLRERQGARVLPRRGAMQALPELLAAGSSVGMLLDQRARVKPVIAPFFGRPARCDRSAGVLLRRLGAPVVLYSCTVRDDGRFHVHIPEVFWPEDLAGLDPTGVATRVNGAMERLILERPEQYFWLHDRYKEAPLAEELSSTESLPENVAREV